MISVVAVFAAATLFAHEGNVMPEHLNDQRGEWEDDDVETPRPSPCASAAPPRLPGDELQSLLPRSSGVVPERVFSTRSTIRAVLLTISLSSSR